MCSCGGPLVSRGITSDCRDEPGHDDRLLKRFASGASRYNALARARLASEAEGILRERGADLGDRSESTLLAAISARYPTRLNVVKAI